MVGFAHLVRMEYVVERARREISESLGWEASSLESGTLVQTTRDLVGEVPQLITAAISSNATPQRLYQHWGELMASWASVCGRADAGGSRERAEIQAFYLEEVIMPSNTLWRELNRALDASYSDSSQRATVLDERVTDPVRSVHWDGLGAFWNPIYERACSER